MDKLSSFAMSVVIPMFIVLGNKALFFVFVTPLIVWRFYMAVKFRKYFSCFKNLIKLSGQSLWLVYHLSYLALFIFESLNATPN
jgi:hypothetical protein